MLSARPDFASKRVQALGLDQDLLWVGCDQGILSAPARSEDWIRYTDADRLPSNNIRQLAFQQDYIWAATDSGAAQFDKFIEEWTSYTTVNSDIINDDILDIASQGDTVWFATADGVSRYDTQREIWMNGVDPVARDGGVYPTLAGCLCGGLLKRCKK